MTAVGVVRIRATASLANQLGYVPLPVKEDGTKAPDLPTWKQYQARRPTDAELKS